MTTPYSNDWGGINRHNGNGAQIVAGKTVKSSTTITRPADTTAYTARDAIANSTSTPAVLSFTGMAGEEAGGGYIVKARLMTNQSTNTARFRLHLYSVAPTPINDNAVQVLLWANRANRVGHIDFDACTTGGSGSDAANSSNANLRMPFVCGAADTVLYGLLETLDGFTPASAQQIYLELTSEQN